MRARRNLSSRAEGRRPEASQEGTRGGWADLAKSVAFYLRVSTGDGQQTIENQRRALDEIAERAGWQVGEVYADEISGTKGRERRPAFDRMRKAAVHRKFDMIADWSVDRLGRSLQDLVAFLGKLKSAGVDLFNGRSSTGFASPIAVRAACVALHTFIRFMVTCWASPSRMRAH